MKNRCCENCRRLSTDVEMTVLTIEGHVANLCLACCYIFEQDSNHERFFKLVRSHAQKEGHPKMAKVHQKLNAMLLVGALFIGGFTSFVVADIINEQETAPTAPYLSFADLHRY